MLSANERINLIVSIFSDRDEFEVVKYLSGGDAQALVDVIDEASIHAISPPKNVPAEIPPRWSGFGHFGQSATSGSREVPAFLIQHLRSRILAPEIFANSALL